VDRFKGSQSNVLHRLIHRSRITYPHGTYAFFPQVTPTRGVPRSSDSVQVRSLLEGMMHRLCVDQGADMLQFLFKRVISLDLLFDLLA
jgi:hypothetical protein